MMAMMITKRCGIVWRGVSQHVNCRKYRMMKSYHTMRPYLHKATPVESAAKDVRVTFVTPEGENIQVVAKEGQHILEVAHNNEVELEGACEASLACSTCHVVLDQDVYDALDPPGEEEEDMLDLAFGLTPTSRLGCQIHLTANLEGMLIRMPAATRNMMVDGHKPKPH